MKIISRTIAALMCGFCLIWINACSSPKQDTEDNGEEFDQAVDELQEQIEDIVHQVPPPAEIPYILQATGVELNEGLVNDISKADTYRSDDDKSALNLGVYATDIGYLSSYEKAQQALSYFSTMKSLADQIGITASIDARVLDRFEDNLDSRDSLEVILNEALENTDEHLRNSGRDRTAALVLTGSFAEALYIASSLVKNYPRNILDEENRKLILIPLVRLILDQEKPLNDLHNLLKSLDSDPVTDQLVAMTSDLVSQYESMDIQEKIRNNEGLLLLEDESLAGLNEKINSLRGYITG